MSELYPEKSLRYKLLDFILNKRRRNVGIGGIIRIPLKKLTSLLEYAHTTDNSGDVNIDRIEALAEELFLLNKETFGNTEKEEKPVIKIENAEILNSLPKHFELNSVLVIKCTSENIEEYISLLKKRTDDAEKALGLSKIKDLSNGKLSVILGNKEAVFLHARSGCLDISINLIRLLYGENVKGTSLREYEKRDHISFDEIIENLNYILDASITQRQLNDVIRNINTKTKKELGNELLSSDDQGLKLIL